MEIDQDQILNRLKINKPSEFPSELHEVAWDIATAFKEPYNNWVRYLKRSKRYPALVRAKYEELAGFKKYKRQDKIKALMAYMQK